MTEPADPGPPGAQADPARIPVQALPGVGPTRAARLAKLGVRTVRDLVCLVPRRLEERGPRATIAEARERVGERVTIAAVVTGVHLFRRGYRRSTLRVNLEDGSGKIDALFFNQPWLRERFGSGVEVELEGQVVESGGQPALSAPRLAEPAPREEAEDEETEDEGEAGALRPRYPLTDGLGQGFVAGLVRRAAAEYADELVETLPEDVLERLEVPPLVDAVRELHAPGSREGFARARRRLALEPVIAMQARLAERRELAAEGVGFPCEWSEEEHAARVGALPHVPTDGQAKVLGELARDLASGRPMRRLLQGDVGSGKTMCALYAAVAVARAGGQTAMLAPTEVLAEQHAYGSADWLAAAGLSGVLLTASLSAAERRRAEDLVETGAADMVFGTHALYSDRLRYHRLALAIVDEQHRFGVEQRRRLFDKGRDLHVLLMTATPIPRTLALTVYGDLDTSVLRGLPPGRGTLGTRWVRGHEHDQLEGFLDQTMGEGGRVFWVCPRIESSDQGRGVEEAHEELAAGALGRHGVELVHGKLGSLERAERLDRFRAGESRLCVGTTVIEVGVDVPEATVMVIEGAERFGLAQLHQLRGRVGRGAGDSWCLLVGERSAKERFELLEKTRDGFEIAEADLRARGMGDLQGVRQTGENQEGLIDPETDLDLLLAARELVGDERVRWAYLEER